MSSRGVSLVLFGFGMFLALPFAAHAVSIPYWGPIVPTLNATCASSWQGFVQLINNLMAFVITIGIVFVAPLIIAYAGFLFVINPVNASGKEKAKTMLWNAVIGLVIMLAAYIIVDGVLTALTTKGGVAAWTNAIFTTSGNPCLAVNTSTLSQATPTLDNGGSGSPTGSNAFNATTGLPLADNGQGTCNYQQDQVAAENDGFNMSTQEAQTLACISSQESSCGANITGAASSAGGPWQVLMGKNAAAYNNNACETAAGVTGPLNCQQGFGVGGVSLGNATSQECQKAAANVTCSLAAANYMVNQRCPNGNVNQASCYADWTTSGDPNHTVQQSCVNEYNNPTGG